MNNFYVYIYIDPRNLEMFYVGKGRGSRKDAHLSDKSDKEKSHRISAIHKAGQKPTIRVIARDLSEHDALLIEKTLLWKLGAQLTNVSKGHFSEYFRPENTLHLDLPGFDFECGVYYYNVGECFYRNWDDYKKFGFISGGGGPRWREAMLRFQKGDVVAAFLKKHGFVGIGCVTDCAKPFREVTIKGKPLRSLPLTCEGMDHNIERDDLCEYVAKVKWAVAVDRSQAKWAPKAGIFTTPLVRASLDAQPKTITFLEREFGIEMSEVAG